MSKPSRELTAIVGVDFSENGDEALARGLTWLEQDRKRTLHLVHVIDPREVLDDPEKSALETQAEMLARLPVQMRERAKLLSKVFGLDPLCACNPERVRTLARIGQPVDALLQACVDYEADLLLVGTHGRRGLERLFLGSVAEMLVRKAHCPVVVARATDYRGCTKTPQPDAPYAPGEPHPRQFANAHEQITSTESTLWHPSDSGPTGFRIV